MVSTRGSIPQNKLREIMIKISSIGLASGTLIAALGVAIAVALEAKPLLSTSMEMGAVRWFA